MKNDEQWDCSSLPAIQMKANAEGEEFTHLAPRHVQKASGGGKLLTS